MDEFKSHIAAAKEGCPICKKPLKDLWTNRFEGLVWRNKCQDSTCLGYRDYRVTYEIQMSEKEPEPPPASRGKKTPKVPAIKISDTWEFVEDYNRWRTAEGNVVKIKELNNEELLDAMHNIRESNFAKHGSHISWMKDLPRKPEKYEYPKDALKVGKDSALAKLEEMREVATERGLIGISR